jgi:hypothetical protein
VLLNRAALLLVLAGCPNHDDELPECNAVGTSDVVIVASDPYSVISDVTDGSQVPLMAAPQGGHIMLVGARVRAAKDCQLAATASLRDPATNRVIGLEQRPLLLERRNDGWAMPMQGLSAMPNVAVCPSSVTTAIDGHDFLLEVSLATLDGESLVTVSATVKPTCIDNFCRSDCSSK